MKHTIWALTLLLAGLVGSAKAEQQPADHCAAMAPFGLPAQAGLSTLLCRRGYVAAHDDVRLVPAWVLERLDATSAWGCGARADAFKVDPDLPRQRRASPADYERSGYDLGHMANAANHLGDAAEQAETFYASNMVPQLHEMNAGLWFKLEVMVRVWAAERHDIQVISGPVLEPDAKTIGTHHIPVPSAFFKVVTDLVTGETLAFLVPHQPLGWREDPARYVVPIAQVEAMSGVQIPRPPGWAIRVEPTAPWPVDILLADNLRTASCSSR